MNIQQKNHSLKKINSVDIQFDHLAYQVENLNLTIDWYTKMFNARINWRVNRGFSKTTTSRLPGIRSLVELQVGGMKWHIFDRANVKTTFVSPTERPEYQHVSVKVANHKMLYQMYQSWWALLNEFRSAYLDINRPEKEFCTNIIEEMDGSKAFYCLDLNGVEIEIMSLNKEGL